MMNKKEVITIETITGNPTVALRKEILFIPFIRLSLFSMTKDKFL